MKKPAIPISFPVTPAQIAAIAENIETITGRRGPRADLATLAAMIVSDPPTQEEVDTLRQALVILVRRLEE